MTIGRLETQDSFFALLFARCFCKMCSYHIVNLKCLFLTFDIWVSQDLAHPLYQIKKSISFLLCVAES